MSPCAGMRPAATSSSAITGTPGASARERREDDQLGGAVGLGHRRSVALGLDVEAAADDLEDRLARLARGVGEVVGPALRRSHAQRGAIRMPPSSRTEAAFM